MDQVVKRQDELVQFGRALNGLKLSFDLILRCEESERVFFGWDVCDIDELDAVGFEIDCGDELLRDGVEGLPFPGFSYFFISIALP